MKEKVLQPKWAIIMFPLGTIVPISFLLGAAFQFNLMGGVDNLLTCVLSLMQGFLFTLVTGNLFFKFGNKMKDKYGVQKK